MVSHVPGSHRKPAGTPLSADGLLPPPAGTAGPAAGAPDAFSAGGDPDWPPDPGAIPWPQWDAPPPMLHPDHPSAPMPRVRVPRGFVPAQGYDQDFGYGAGQVVPFPERLAPTAAQDEAAAIRRTAEQDADAICQAAEREAAELRAVVLEMSAQLGWVAGYVTEYLGKHALWDGSPQAQPAAVPRPGIAPREEVTRLARAATGRVGPDSRTARRRGAPPTPRPSDRSGARQATAMRKMVVVFITLFAVAVVGGLMELGLHGFNFFVFRSAGTGATDNNGLQENQGPGQPDAPAAHHAKSAAHHSAPKPKAQRSASA